MRKLLVATAGRLDYGIYRAILNRIEREPDLGYALLVTGGHLSAAAGATVDEIERDGRPIAARIPLPDTSAGPAAATEAMAAALSGTGRAIAEVVSTWWSSSATGLR